MTTTRLDRVSIFGDKLSLLIPHEWIEEQEDGDHYLYHAPNADSGWLRISLITAKNSPERARELLTERANQEGGRLYESAGNIVAAWEKPSEEDGVPIYHYWWTVEHSHGPQLSREALFTYTILRDRREDAETQQTVSLLSDLIANAEFLDSAEERSVH